MADQDLIAEGRRLLTDASPSPWNVCDDNEGDGWPPRPLWCIRNPEFDTAEDTDEWHGLNIVVDTGTKADAELIAHMRNTYGAVLDELEQARKSVAALQLRLEPPGSPQFESLLSELGIDMTDPQEILAEKAVSQRYELEDARARITELEKRCGNLSAMFSGAEHRIDELEAENIRLAGVEQLHRELEQQAGHRVIETAEELDALPDRSIIQMHCGSILQMHYDTVAQKSDDVWEVPNEVGQYTSDAIDLPAIVLWRPEVSDRG